MIITTRTLLYDIINAIMRRRRDATPTFLDGPKLQHTTAVLQEIYDLVVSAKIQAAGNLSQNSQKAVMLRIFAF